MRLPQKVGRFLVSALLTIATGCTPLAAPVTPNVSSPRSASANLSAPQNSRYQNAVALYKAKNYSGAIHEIDSLLSTTTDAKSRAYLLKQRAICQAAAAGKPVPATVSVPAAKLPMPVDSTATSGCGPRSLLFICNQLGIRTDFETLCRAAKVTANGTTLADLKRAAQSVGLKADGVQMDNAALQHLQKPAIAWVDGNHYIALLAVTKNPLTGNYSATIHDPNHTAPETISLPDLLSRGGGVLLMLERHKG